MTRDQAPRREEGPGLAESVATILAALGASGSTLATAESLTGGLLTAALTAVPGSSAVVRGGVVAYATDLKTALLGVDVGLLEEAGPVDARVAVAMAQGARRRLGATHGVATTGEAGPDSSSGQPVGTVHVAVCSPGGTARAAVLLGGDRDAVRRGAVEAAVALLGEVVVGR